MKDRFNDFMVHLFNDEGGYVNDPKDPGGETNFGITKKFFPHLDIKNLTKDKAKEIYKNQYYLNSFVSRVEDDKLANALFNLSVHTGASRVKVLCNKILLEFGDNEIDRNLEDRVNATDVNEFRENVKEEMRKYYLRRVQDNGQLRKFLKGWLNRIERL